MPPAPPPPEHSYSVNSSAPGAVPSPATPYGDAVNADEQANSQPWPPSLSFSEFLLLAALCPLGDSLWFPNCVTKGNSTRGNSSGLHNPPSQESRPRPRPDQDGRPRGATPNPPRKVAQWSLGWVLSSSSRVRELGGARLPPGALLHPLPSGKGRLASRRHG